MPIEKPTLISPSDDAEFEKDTISVNLWAKNEGYVLPPGLRTVGSGKISITGSGKLITIQV